MKGARYPTTQAIDSVIVLSGTENWRNFKISFLEFTDRFPHMRASLVDLSEPDCSARYNEVYNSLNFYQSLTEARETDARELNTAAPRRSPRLNRSNPSDESEASVSVPDEMEQLRIKTAFERVEHEHAE